MKFKLIKLYALLFCITCSTFIPTLTSAGTCLENIRKSFKNLKEGYLGLTRMSLSTIIIPPIGVPIIASIGLFSIGKIVYHQQKYERYRSLIRSTYTYDELFSHYLTKNYPKISFENCKKYPQLKECAEIARIMKKKTAKKEIPIQKFYNKLISKAKEQEIKEIPTIAKLKEIIIKGNNNGALCDKSKGRSTRNLHKVFLDLLTGDLAKDAGVTMKEGDWNNLENMNSNNNNNTLAVNTNNKEKEVTNNKDPLFEDINLEVDKEYLDNTLYYPNTNVRPPPYNPGYNPRYNPECKESLEN
ncbi:MAG: hypothetical protein HQK49_17725 [Oligoflexia bacterium]|nr:hypothetical protein [Oligoflexia bacterium]